LLAQSLLNLGRQRFPVTGPGLLMLLHAKTTELPTLSTVRSKAGVYL
jgi:hypothetical protein